MANGKIRFGKQSGGKLALVFPDGVDDTEVIFPERGELATTAFVGAEIVDKAYSKTQLDAGQLDNRYYTETEIDTKLSDANLTRADKVLASKNIARLIYESGNLTKIRYNTDSDVDYEVLTYSGEDLVNVAHYINEELKGNTVMTYASDELVSSIFIGV